MDGEDDLVCLQKLLSSCTSWESDFNSIIDHLVKKESKRGLLMPAVFSKDTAFKESLQMECIEDCSLFWGGCRIPTTVEGTLDFRVFCKGFFY